MGKADLAFHLVSLGCPKNTVDSEQLMGAFATAGWAFAEAPGDADVCLVNTCGFLRASCEEAQATIAALRKAAPKARMVALGCLPERAGANAEMAEYLAGADACVGFADYARLPEICRQLLDGEATVRRANGYCGDTLPKSYLRWLSGPAWRYSGLSTGWLKLGEGCSNHCAYCAIPTIRGDRASRPLDAVLKNARQLLDDGASELNLVAQDTTAYGMDFDGKSHLGELLRGLLRFPDTFFLRILYAHPRHLTPGLLRLMASDDRICPYLDLPIQHSETAVLRAMHRGYDGARVRRLVEQARELVPDLALRTTLITGHPGETPAEFDQLLAFVAEGHFDHLGAFAWSPEPGTAAVAAAAKGVPTATAREAIHRQKLVMEVQKSVSAARWAARRGTQTVVFPDAAQPRPDGLWSCHSLFQAPDGLDGTCLLRVPRDLAYRFDPALPAVATIARTSAYSIRTTLAPLD